MAVTVVVAPLPVIVTPPGVLVSVQVPVAGNPLNTTDPVDIAHVGWVIVPTTGAVGEEGWGLITTSADAAEVHDSALVTIKLYVPATRPDIKVEVPVPLVIIDPGFLISVQVPVAGKPIS